jgi:hypothetical protein
MVALLPEGGTAVFPKAVPPSTTSRVVSMPKYMAACDSLPAMAALKAEAYPHTYWADIGNKVESLLMMADLEHASVPVAWLEQCVDIAPKHDVRYYLQGVAFFPEHGHMVATDGHRLYRYEVGLPAVGKPFIVHRSAVDLAVKAARALKAESVSVRFNPDGGQAGHGAYLLTVGDMDRGPVLIGGRCIEGNFPDYKRVCMMPLTVEHSARTIIPASWIDTLKETAKVAKAAGVDTLGALIDWNKSKVGVYKDRVEKHDIPWLDVVDSLGKGFEPTAFRSSYLIDACGAVLGQDESADIVQADGNSPLFMVTKSLLVVLMPMRI